MGTGCSGYSNGASRRFTEESDGQTTFKVVVIGAAETGKSSILRRYLKNQFHTAYEPTKKVVIESVVKKINQPGEMIISLTFWDIPSREDINLRPSYYTNVSAAIVVVDVTSRESIELAGSWKQDFVNQATTTRHTIVSADGHDEVRVEELPSDPSIIPVLLLGNKFDLVEEKLHTEHLQASIAPPPPPGESSLKPAERPDSTVRDTKPYKEKPECLKLLEHVELEHGFIGSVVVSARNEDFSVHTAMQSFLRHLLEGSVTRRKTRVKNEAPPLVGDIRGDDTLQLTGIDELDGLFARCLGPIRRSHNYLAYYRLVLKSFKQLCADMGCLTETKASLEDAIIGLRDALRASNGLQLKATNEDRFVSLSHGAEDDEDVKVPRELDKLIAQFNSEYAALCQAILRDCPAMSVVLTKLDTKLASKTVDTSSTDQPIKYINTLNAICERNRARIAYSIRENDESVRIVEDARRRIHVALLW